MGNGTYSRAHPNVVLFLRALETRDLTSKQAAAVLHVSRSAAVRLVRYCRKHKLIYISFWIHQRGSIPVYSLRTKRDQDVPRPARISAAIMSRNQRIRAKLNKLAGVK